jgi:trans-aconitate 2-methyltransferase
MSEWNPDLYLKFEKERTQPARDLVYHIKKDKAARIIDIGCGPGNSTIELKKKWPDAHIIGIDSSVNMIHKAKLKYPELVWEIIDANNDLSPLGSFDIVFSNAAIQWMPNHEKLLPRLFNLLNDGGVLAVQVPNTTHMPITAAIHKTTNEERWKDRFKSMDNSLTEHALAFYYDVLCSLSPNIYLWETHYHHVLSGHEAIIEWYSSTGMKPYLEILNSEERLLFIQSVLRKIRRSYKKQMDGMVLFPFRRLFFIAYR